MTFVRFSVLSLALSGTVLAATDGGVEIQRSGGVVEESGPSEVRRTGPSKTPVTDITIRTAATAAKRALASAGTVRHIDVTRFINVLGGLEKFGKDFDDTYYPIAPTRDGTWNPAACFKDDRRDCLPAERALENCTRHLAPELIWAYDTHKDDARKFAEWAEIKANDIHRGFRYLLPTIDGEMAAGYCPAVKGAIKQSVVDSAARGWMGIYGYY